VHIISHPGCNAEVKNERICISTPLIRPHDVHRNIQMYLFSTDRRNSNDENTTLIMIKSSDADHLHVQKHPLNVATKNIK
jgi:hypothetical protein